MRNIVIAERRKVNVRRHIVSAGRHIVADLERIMFNEGEPRFSVTDGKIELLD